MTRDRVAARSRRRRASIAAMLTAIAVAVAAGAVAPGAAQAGSYPMNACNVPGAATGTRGPWVIQPNANGSATNIIGYDSCSLGGSFGHHLPSGAMSPGSMGTVDLTRIDAAIRVTGLKAWFSGNLGAGGGSPVNTLIWIDGSQVAAWGAPGITFSGTPYVSQAELGGSFQLATYCGNNAGQPCSPNTYPLVISGIQATLSEANQPAASIAGGTLVTAGPKTGTHTVVARGADPHSGVQKLEVLMDDKVVGSVAYDRDWSRPLGEQKAGTCTFADWNACATTQSHEASVNTRFLPDGVYRLAVRASDAAGNVATSASHPVTIDNVPDPVPPAPPAPAPAAAGPVGPSGGDGAAGAPGSSGPAAAGGAAAPVIVVNGVNGSASASITAAFAGRGRSSVRQGYGRTVLITGHVVAPGGAPVTGAHVHVLHRDRLDGAGMVPAGEVVTDGTGRFRYVTTAVRSRTIRFAYRAQVGDMAIADTTDVALSVAPRITLRRNRSSLRNGQVVTFSGAVAGAPGNARKVVELQVKKGRRWMTFRSTRLHKGAFRERYRFVNTRSRQTYVFRARVRQESGFPFASGASKPVKVTVRG
jgi:hypothetical protein